MDWRERISSMSRDDIINMSAEEMAARRIMKGLGSRVNDIGRLCTTFKIPYDENESRFNKAVKILREVFHNMALVNFIDVRTGKSVESLYDDLLEDPRTCILFFRKDKSESMTALIKGQYLTTSALGKIVIRPGCKYLRCKDGVEIWEQDPVLLIKSFSEF